MLCVFGLARVMKNMYLLKSSDTRPLTIGALSMITLFLLAVPTILFGLYFGPLVKLAGLMF